MTQSLTIEIRTAIAAPIEQFMVAFSRGNAAGVAAVYTEDAQVCHPTAMSLAVSRQSRRYGRGP